MSSFPFSYFGAPSEEQLQQLQMEGESFTRQIVAFLRDDLSKDQMFSLLAVLALVNKSPRTNGYFSGMVTSGLAHRFDVCMCRGQDVSHDHTLASHFDLGEDVEVEQAAPEPEPQADVSAEEPEATTRTLTPEEILELEDVYKLDHSDVEGDTRVRCRRCGMEYPSIEDRMLRGVGECTGCEQAEKSGAWLDRWA